MSVEEKVFQPCDLEKGQKSKKTHTEYTKGNSKEELQSDSIRADDPEKKHDHRKRIGGLFKGCLMIHKFSLLI